MLACIHKTLIHEGSHTHSHYPKHLSTHTHIKQSGLGLTALTLGRVVGILTVDDGVRLLARNVVACHDDVEPAEALLAHHAVNNLPSRAVSVL
jgi:hypothetical protein